MFGHNMGKQKIYESGVYHESHEYKPLLDSIAIG